MAVLHWNRDPAAMHDFGIVISHDHCAAAAHVVFIDAVKLNEINRLIGTVEIGDAILEPSADKGQMRVGVDRLCFLLALAEFAAQLHPVVKITGVVREDLLHRANKGI